MRDLFAETTRQIIRAIEAGADSYHMPWHRAGANIGAPVNAVSGRAYRGVNVLLLWAAAEASGYGSGRWATYRQWRQRGAQVRRGEQATAIFFWKPTGSACNDNDEQATATDDEGSVCSRRGRLLARVYHLFNAAQVEGDDRSQLPELPQSARIDAAEAFFAAIPATIRQGGDEACYIPSRDEIMIPPFGQFREANGYYSVLAHELTHWTGSRPRLDRDLAGRFGSHSYAMEELVAELGSAFLMAELGLASEPRRDHAPYIASWLQVLADDPRAIVTAASKAQEAVDYLEVCSQRNAECAA